MPRAPATFSLSLVVGWVACGGPPAPLPWPEGAVEVHRPLPDPAWRDGVVVEGADGSVTYRTGVVTLPRDERVVAWMPEGLLVHRWKGRNRGMSLRDPDTGAVIAEYPFDRAFISGDGDEMLVGGPGAWRRLSWPSLEELPLSDAVRGWRDGFHGVAPDGTLVLLPTGLQSEAFLIGPEQATVREPERHWTCGNADGHSGPGRPVPPIRLSPSGTAWVQGGSFQRLPWSTVERLSERAVDAGFSADGRSLVVVDPDGIGTYDVPDTGRPMPRWRHPLDEGRTAAIGATGVVAVVDGGRIRLFSPAGAELLVVSASWGGGLREANLIGSPRGDRWLAETVTGRMEIVERDGFWQATTADPGAGVHALGEGVVVVQGRHSRTFWRGDRFLQVSGADVRLERGGLVWSEGGLSMPLGETARPIGSADWSQVDAVAWTTRDLIVVHSASTGRQVAVDAASGAALGWTAPPEPIRCDEDPEVQWPWYRGPLSLAPRAAGLAVDCPIAAAQERRTSVAPDLHRRADGIAWSADSRSVVVHRDRGAVLLRDGERVAMTWAGDGGVAVDGRADHLAWIDRGAIYVSPLDGPGCSSERLDVWNVLFAPDGHSVLGWGARGAAVVDAACRVVWRQEVPGPGQQAADPVEVGELVAGADGGYTRMAPHP